MRLRMLSLVALLALAAPAAAQQPPAAGAQQPNGAAVFQRACASCHQAAAPGTTEAPSPEVLRGFTPEAIVNALTNGRMSVQGATLSPAEHRAVAQFLTGRAPAATAPAATAASSNRCTAATPATDPARGPNWMSWGNDATNARFAAQAGLTAADLPRLKLKWAFGYAGATAARVQPALAGGKLFVASDNSEVHALDPKTGCTYWTFKADSGVRSALSVGPYKAGARSGYAVFFGDQKANAYAVDSITGQPIWKRQVDTHASAAITGALAIHDNRVFVPVQGLNEEGSGGRGQTPCCTFRGSLSALDAGTGAVIWKTYTVDEPKVRGKNTRTGQDAYGPAGGGIWAPPTVDVKRRAIYVATGNAYADPPQPMTDAVDAMDMDTGKVKWVYQATANDNWLGGCGARSGGNPGCPEVQGPDHDFSAAPLLATANGRQLVIVPQKSGMAYAIDPDKGSLVWMYRFGQGSGLGGQWGAAADAQNVYFGVGDYLTQNAGGLRAVKIATGEQVWSAPPPNPKLCAAIPRCNASQGGAVSVIPGAVIAGSHDGGIRGYSAEDGKVLWEFDTNKEFQTVNGVKATGASIDGSPLIIGDGMIYVNSGYGGIAARPGNVLLAFSVE
jgi:polyvinyl alcohol dehydrogenase (cytochrome)